MRKTLAVLTALTMALVIMAPSAGAAPADYRGNWSAIDPWDGSSMTMSIGVRRPYPVANVRLYDDAATICGGLPAWATGTGDPSGKNMTVELTVRCEGDRTPIGVFEMVLFAHPDGTLTDLDGTLWTRG